MPPGDYARAFALNFVFFLAAILIYALFIPAATVLQVLILTALSIFFTAARIAQLNRVERSFDFTDEAVFVAVITQYMTLHDNWTVQAEADGYQRYTAATRLGLYRFTGELDVRITYEQATLTGHALIVRPLERELNRPGVAALSPGQAPR